VSGARHNGNPDPASPPEGVRRSLLDCTRAPDYTAQVLDAVTTIATAAETATAVRVLKLGVERLGADAAVFTSFVRDDAALWSFRYLLACDPVWGLEYAKNGWCFDDPWLHYALYSADPIRSSELSSLNERERWVSDAAAHWGFRSAVIVPVPSPAAQSRVCVLCLGSEVEGYFDGDGYPAFRCMARMLASELADWMHRRVKADIITKARITSEDLALLRHEQQGHGSKLIAAEMHSGINTIDCRFHRLSLRLGTANRREAVRLAEIYGLI
jgi:hypothetical protein